MLPVNRCTNGAKLIKYLSEMNGTPKAGTYIEKTILAGNCSDEGNIAADTSWLKLSV